MPLVRRLPALVFALLLSASCGSGGGPPPPDCSWGEFQDGFESGLQAWQTGYDLPLDPNRPGEVVMWSITASGEQAAEGTTSARYYLDGTQDDGTIWLVRAFDVPPGADGVVHLSFQLWSETESFNDVAVVVAYAGPTPPAEELDFDLTRRANDVAGWETYEYAFPVTSDGTGRIWVAFGISAVFETEMTYFIDDVRVCLDGP